MGVRVALTTLLDTSSETDRKHNSNKRDEELTKVALEYTGGLLRKESTSVCVQEKATPSLHTMPI